MFGFINQVILIAVITILCVLFIVITQMLLANDRFQTKYLNRSSLRTGDLIVSSSSIRAGSLVPIFTQSIWSHPGMIIVDPNGNITVIEVISKYKGKKHNCLHQIPLDDWMEYWKNHHICIVKMVGPDISYDRVIESYHKYQHIRLEPFGGTWIRLIQNIPYDGKQRKKAVCYEVINMILQDLGIVKKRYNPGSYSCSNTVYGIIDTNLPYRYEQGYEIFH